MQTPRNRWFYLLVVLAGIVGAFFVGRSGRRWEPAGVVAGGIAAEGSGSPSEQRAAWQAAGERGGEAAPAPAQLLPAEMPIAPPPRAVMPDSDRQAMLALQARFHVGDYQSCLEMAERFLADKGRSPIFLRWLREQMPAILVSSAWMEIKTGRCETAIIKLREAAALRRTAESASGLAFCYYKEHEWQRAEEELAWYLQQKPGDAQAWLLRADIAESLFSYGQAVEALEKASALASGPLQETTAERMATMRRKKAQSLRQQSIESAHFVLTFDADGHGGLVDSVLALLEEALIEFAERWCGRIPTYPIEVILYPSEDFAGAVGEVPHWAGGVFDGRIRIPIGGWQDSRENWQSLRQTLRHELVHAVLAFMSDRRGLPPWLEEGLADRFAYAGEILRVFPFSETPGHFLAAAAFEEPFVRQSSKIAAGQLYRQSLYMVLVLERTIDEGALARVVEGVSAEKPLGSSSLLAPLGLSLESLVERSRLLWQKQDGLERR